MTSRALSSVHSHPMGSAINPRSALSAARCHRFLAIVRVETYTSHDRPAPWRRLRRNHRSRWLFSVGCDCPILNRGYIWGNMVLGNISKREARTDRYICHYSSAENWPTRVHSVSSACRAARSNGNSIASHEATKPRHVRQ